MKYEVVAIGLVEKTEREVNLIIESQFRNALINLNQFSHAIVLWWIHERDTPEDRMTLLVKPWKAKGRERSGIFACRSPLRPNPIGHSVVRVASVDVENGVVALDQIDAQDGTPVLDIKPYLPSSDKVDNAKIPWWFEHLERRYSA